MEESLQQLTSQLQEGTWIIAKILIQYLFIPLVLAGLVHKIIKIRGSLFKLLFGATWFVNSKSNNFFRAACDTVRASCILMFHGSGAL